ncbi:MAG: DNA repair protein RadA [Candidatus Buchananbacteria bacterium]
MSKPQTIFSCTKCGAQYPKWQGRCLTCGAWSTINEEIAESSIDSKSEKKFSPDKTIDLSTLANSKEVRIITDIDELDRVLGGGIVKGSFMLLGGDPGVGKSTLALQMIDRLKNALYVSGEESASQIKLRAERLKSKLNNWKFLPQTNIEKIIATALDSQPELLIIDSIQTVHTDEATGSAGSVSQITACAAKLMELAKANDISILVIGHVTKDGQVAGPKTLEHLVDTVMYLENDDKNYLKILRAVKNRFGSVGEIGIFEMSGGGLIEVKNPAQIFIDKELDLNRAGIATTMVYEGTRPFLAEIQALTAKTFFGYPVRKATGFDLNRLQMLIAVIGKYAKVNLSSEDVYLNIAGGLKIKDTAADLATILAIISAEKNLPLGGKTLILGEVGLAGEIRSLPQLERRIKEGEKMGFEKFIVPNAKGLNGKNIYQIKNIAEAIELIRK